MIKCAKASCSKMLCPQDRSKLLTRRQNMLVPAGKIFRLKWVFDIPRPITASVTNIHEGTTPPGGGNQRSQHFGSYCMLVWWVGAKSTPLESKNNSRKTF